MTKMMNGFSEEEWNKVTEIYATLLGGFSDRQFSTEYVHPSGRKFKVNRIGLKWREDSDITEDIFEIVEPEGKQVFKGRYFNLLSVAIAFAGLTPKAPKGYGNVLHGWRYENGTATGNGCEETNSLRKGV